MVVIDLVVFCPLGYVEVVALLHHCTCWSQIERHRVRQQRVGMVWGARISLFSWFWLDKGFPGDPPDPMICRTHTDIHSQLQSLITQQPWQQSIKGSSS
jgi:hypothetical protein